MREGAPADIIQGIEEPSITLTQELMKRCDLVIATGGRPMVKSAYSSGVPPTAPAPATRLSSSTTPATPPSVRLRLP